jgi:uncharacterized membrane protein HdeD (DUF308 family)
MLLDGVLAIVAALRAARRHERWGLLILEGVANLIAGGIALFWPLITIVALIYLIAAWAIVSGSLLLAASFRLNVAHGRWLMFFGGAASMVWGDPRAAGSVALAASPLAGLTKFPFREPRGGIAMRISSG